MFKILTYLSLFGSALTQFRDPILTIQNTIWPIITLGPIRTIAPIRTIETITPSFSTTITSTQTNQIQTNQTEDDITDKNVNLIYILVPSLISALLCLGSIYAYKRKQKKNNQLEVTKQESINSTTSNHIYEEINYDDIYEMPEVRTENIYGRQVSTII